ncbi:DUF3999 domain-containing protein [Burkholderia sp. MR1-5-21]
MKPLVALLGLSALASFASFAATGIARADAPVAQRFALDLDGSAAYYTVTVPPAVYAASRRNDLGDLRVFNGAGEPVPYSLDAPAAAEPPPQRHPVPWFPLLSADANADVNTAHAPLGVSVAADGSLRATVPAPPRARRTADLVDLSHAGGQASALLIHLRNDSYQGRVSIEASDDLQSWQPLTDTQLLKVAYDGHTLAQERIALDGVRQRYLRLNWLDGAPDIASAEAETRMCGAPKEAPVTGAPDEVPSGCTPDGAAAPRQWRDGVRMRAGGAPGEYLFETDGAYPVDRLRLGLPQPNTVAHATIQARADTQAPWHDVADAMLFRLQGKAGEQRNPPLEFAADADRLWRIVVDMRNGGLGGGLPAATVGWRPASLTFVARGAAPFTLGVGNAALASAAVSRDALLIGTSTEIRPARVGDALPVAPPAASPPAAVDTDAPRRYVLWASLVIAVGALASIAWRLARGGGPQDRGRH